MLLLQPSRSRIPTDLKVVDSAVEPVSSWRQKFGDVESREGRYVGENRLEVPGRKGIEVEIRERGKRIALGEEPSAYEENEASDGTS